LGFTLIATGKTAEDIDQLANAAAESGAKITFVYDIQANSRPTT
jgi:hypothetical protein